MARTACDARAIPTTQRPRARRGAVSPHPSAPPDDGIRSLFSGACGRCRTSGGWSWWSGSCRHTTLSLSRRWADRQQTLRRRHLLPLLVASGSGRRLIARGDGHRRHSAGRRPHAILQDAQHRDMHMDWRWPAGRARKWTVSKIRPWRVATLRPWCAPHTLHEIGRHHDRHFRGREHPAGVATGRWISLRSRRGPLSRRSIGSSAADTSAAMPSASPSRSPLRVSIMGPRQFPCLSMLMLLRAMRQWPHLSTIVLVAMHSSAATPTSTR